MVEAKHSVTGNILYTVLTLFIILLGKLRDMVCSNKNLTATLRNDRTIPWNKDIDEDICYMSCCDCGLSHLLIPGHSVTPIRTRKYSYGLRLGAHAWAEPDKKLGEEAYDVAKRVGLVAG